jgi:hypothetical protein
MLEDVIRECKPNQLQSGFDLTDAFHLHPLAAEHGDLAGMRNGAGDYFRYRYVFFGGSQAPSIQQRWARELKNVIEERALDFCTPWSEGAARREGFRCAGAYLDDFHLLHPLGISEEGAREQFEGVHALLTHLGFEAKRSKDIWPTHAKEYVGFIINTADQTVTITEERSAKLTAAIEEFEERARGARHTADRLDVASLAGKLQFVAPVIRGSQGQLRELYRARDAFETEGVREQSTRAQWREGVRVRLHPEVYRSLAYWKERLRDIPSRPVYLSNMVALSGFWRGLVPELDEEIDAAGGDVTEDGIQVCTTDASGFAGGAWWQHRRHILRFGTGEAAPARSSNWRELATAVNALEGRKDNSYCKQIRVLSWQGFCPSLFWSGSRFDALRRCVWLACAAVVFDEMDPLSLVAQRCRPGRLLLVLLPPSFLPPFPPFVWVVGGSAFLRWWPI